MSLAHLHDPGDLLEHVAAEELSARSHEDLFDALTAWMREPGKSRTFTGQSNSLGIFVRLHELGQLQGYGRGRSSDQALEDALQQAGVLP